MPGVSCIEQGYILFCEDVRDETGNKSSFMGVLGSSIAMPEDGPSKIRFCCVLLLRASSRSVVIRGRFELHKDQEKPLHLAPMEFVAEQSQDDSTEIWTITTIAKLPSVSIPEKMSKIVATFEADGDLLTATLEIERKKRENHSTAQGCKEC